jgi:hypothetical protein
VLFAAVHMSPFGTKRTCPAPFVDVRYRGRADSTRGFPEWPVMTHMRHGGSRLSRRKIIVRSFAKA